MTGANLNESTEYQLVPILSVSSVSSVWEKNGTQRPQMNTDISGSDKRHTETTEITEKARIKKNFREFGEFCVR